MPAIHRGKTIKLKLDRPLKAAFLLKNDAELIKNYPNQVDSNSQASSINSVELPVTQGPSSAISPSILNSSEIDKRFLELVEKIERQLSEQNQQLSQIIGQFPELAIKTSLMIAETVVGYEVEHHETRIRNLLFHLIEKHQWQTPPAVFVNNLDLDRLRITLPDAPSLDSMLDLKRDDSIAVGDCRVESSIGSVTANFRRQLSEIQLQLMERLHDAKPEPEDLK